jgi:hypothetical protein
MIPSRIIEGHKKSGSNRTHAYVRTLAAALGSAAFVGSCGSAGSAGLRDISLTSIDIVSPSQILDPGYALQAASSNAYRTPMVRVMLSTTDDFQVIAKEKNEVNVNVEFGVCKGNAIDPNRRLTGYPDVYDQNAMVDIHRPSEFGPSRKGASSRISSPNGRPFVFIRPNAGS